MTSSSKLLLIHQGLGLRKINNHGNIFRFLCKMNMLEMSLRAHHPARSSGGCEAGPTTCDNHMKSSSEGVCNHNSNSTAH